MTDSWSNKYIDLPYTRFDCWQLCVKVYLDELDVDLPDFVGEYPRKPELQIWSDMILGETQSGPWETITHLVEEQPSLANAQPMDVLLFYVAHRDFPTHLGMFVDRGHMLTTKRSTGSLHEKIGAWQKRLCGIYRYKVKENGIVGDDPE